MTGGGATMKGLNSSTLMTLMLAAGMLPAATLAQDPAAMRDVTDERLRNPEPENWLMFRGGYEGWGYSPLADITPANVMSAGGHHAGQRVAAETSVDLIDRR